MHMKNINRCLLLLCCLLMVNQSWSKTWLVSNTSLDQFTENSLPYILSNINEGDIVTFDSGLIGKAIDLESGEGSIQTESNCSIIGNGVTIKNGYFYLIASTKVEGITFESMEIGFYGAQEVTFTNCTFIDNCDEYTFYNGEEATQAYFEGCSFISKSKLTQFKLDENLPKEIYLTSCSFYNGTSVNKPLFYTNGESIDKFILTNCALISTYKISDFPISSGGYNVIKSDLYEGSQKQESDIAGTDIEDPFILIDNIPYVRPVSNAYQHLPANQTFNDNNIRIPYKDIKGNIIDYTYDTHSGASQETRSDLVALTGISLNKSSVKFTLFQKEINETLIVSPTPENAVFDKNLLKWSSSNPEIATVNENGVITAVAPGETTIKVIYDEKESIMSTCDVEVFKYITVTNKEEEGEGSLNAILSALQDGDIISFSDELKDTPITLPNANQTDASDKRNQINKSIKILGNGVTLAGQCLTLKAQGVVTIENLNFQNSGINARYNTDTIYIRNCKFEENSKLNVNNTQTAIYAPTSSALVVEGSLFNNNTTATAIYAEWNKGYNAHIHLTSCSFINTRNESTYSAYDSPGNIIHVPYIDGMEGSSLQRPTEIILTNCVIQDNPPRNEGAVSPAISAPIIRSKGYNVIKGLIATKLTGSQSKIFDTVVNELSSDKKDVVSASMQNPIIADNGIYKVVSGRSAENHFPGNTSIPGVNLPSTDINENTINYTSSTHSGANQETIQATQEIKDIKLFTPNSTLNSGKTTDIEVIISPENAKSENFTWTSNKEDKATVNDGVVTALAKGENAEVSITAKYGKKEATLDLLINGTLATGVTFKKENDTVYIGYPKQLIASVVPENAAYQLQWSSSDETIATVDEKGNITPKAKGTTTITVKEIENESISASCTISIEKPDYTNGVFLVNEDWYMHFNGTVNYLTPEGKWLYRVIQQENPDHELGATTQFGTIYGDKFYLVSKQEKDPGAVIAGSRFAICDAKTMKLEQEFKTIEYNGNNGDGRSFLGVDEKTGYVSTSNGIYIFDLKNNQFTGKIEGTEGDGQGGGDPENNPNLYSGQVGTMLRIGDRVFANHQKKGLLVINPATNKVDTVLDKYHFTAIAQSKDGDLWAGTTQDITGGPSGNRADKRLIKIDPWTLSITEIPLTIEGPYVNWGAWRADAFCASGKENKLYWRDMPTFFGKTIYEYDIATNTTRTLFDLTKYENGRWRIYETGFRIDPVTNNLYISVNGGEPINQGGACNRTLKLDPSTGEVSTYELDEYYWFPAMYVFPDNEKPVIGELSDKLTLTSKHLTVPLHVTDADNMDATIIKSVSNKNTELIEATIIRDELRLTLLKSVTETESAVLALTFNSNGKIITKEITVSAENIELIPATGIKINQSAASMTVGDVLQLTAAVQPDNAADKDVLWSSSDASTVSVTANGLIKAVKAGTATITVRSAYEEVEAKCVVTVSNPVVTPPEVVFQLNKQALTLYVNQMEQLTTNAESDQSVEWSTSDASVATVNNGQAIAHKTGSATITALNKATGKSASCEIAVQETDILPEVDVEETAAYIIFPRLEEADYYLVSVYKRINGLQTLAFMLKVGKDGSLLRSTRAQSGDINIYLSNLETGTEYVTVIEAMRTKLNGKDEVIKVLSTPSFMTSSSTGNNLVSAQKPEVYYHGNTLLLKGMEEYTCYIVTLNGQVRETFDIAASEEIHQTNLSAGIYLLTGIKENKKVTFKFIAK